MFSKKEIDDLVAGCLAELPVEDFSSESDFQVALCDALSRNSDPTLWEWTREDPYATLGLPNAGAVYFDICGVYDKSCKILIELKYVMGEPKDFYAFPYDILKDCIKIELAMSSKAETAPAQLDYPVVYGLSIGITDVAAYWENLGVGINAWSKNSLNIFHGSVAEFRWVNTCGGTPKALYNSIFRNKRCHLSFALDWRVQWGDRDKNWRVVVASPPVLINPSEHAFEYFHALADSTYIPFLTPKTQNDWVERRMDIVG